jgi:hypothetical protein
VLELEECLCTRSPSLPEGGAVLIDRIVALIMSLPDPTRADPAPSRISLDQNSRSFSLLGPFLEHKSPRIRQSLPGIFLWGRAMELAMSHWRKSSCQPTSQYNAYLAGWAFAFSVVLVTFMLIAHGVHF